MQILRKKLSKKIEGNIKTVVFERIEKELLTKKEIDELTDEFSGDNESAFIEYGLSFDYSDDLIGVNLETLTKGLESFIECAFDEEEKEERKSWEAILKKITPWKEYYLDFEEVEQK